MQVGFYQIAKLCVIPFVCAVEYWAYTRRFSHTVILSISLVVLGVGIVTVSDVAVNWAGLNVAVLSIVAAGSQQLLCRHQQRTLNITSNEMLLFTAWPMAGLLLVIGPSMDWAITGGTWVMSYGYSTPVVVVIASTCALAIGVNLSQFACLGRFTAVAYQVSIPLSFPHHPPKHLHSGGQLWQPGHCLDHRVRPCASSPFCREARHVCHAHHGSVSPLQQASHHVSYTLYAWHRCNVPAHMHLRSVSTADDAC